MRCPNCAAEISALRDTCPHCGASTDRAFERLDSGERGRSPQELARNRKTVLWVVGGILVVTAVMGNIRPFGRHVSFGPGVVHIDTDRHRRDPVTIGAAQLFEAYHTDSRAAARGLPRAPLSTRTAPPGRPTSSAPSPAGGSS